MKPNLAQWIERPNVPPEPHPWMEMRRWLGISLWPVAVVEVASSVSRALSAALSGSNLQIKSSLACL
jgi:hypothetical protein